MSTIEHYFRQHKDKYYKVLSIMLHKYLTHKCKVEPQCVIFQMKAIEQYSHASLFIMQYKVVVVKLVGES